MDLFIIIAAVLGVGGVVSASVYSLVNSATANSSVAVVGASLKAGASASAAPAAVTVSIKNNGGSTISCTASTCQVAFAGTNSGTALPSCSSATCSLVSGGSGMVWALGPAGAPLTLTLTGTLAPGAEASVVINGAIAETSGTFWSAGTPVTMNVLFGSASTQITVVSQ
ncbi:MAG: hypothetical protein JRN08_05855 [Nitrososphaerota archaeon]|nr:hypothetical protein [Nitrososphaerota archaeon]